MRRQNFNDNWVQTKVACLGCNVLYSRYAGAQICVYEQSSRMTSIVRATTPVVMSLVVEYNLSLTIAL